ncbi:hypothetical protein [Rhodopirellula bahusiensis]|uniref:hypothetical protein n=1 Tax=Rhodopirellula bahusiensis TaxID=2014065 RepID=UPI003264BA48
MLVLRRVSDGARTRDRNPSIWSSQTFDRERLDADLLSINNVARSFETSPSLSGLRRQARDQWLRAAILDRTIVMLP